MTDQQVAELLANDLNANFIWIQLGFSALCCILLIIAATLATRAYSALSEARMLLYHKTRASTHGRDPARQSTPQNIAAAAQRRKPKSAKRTLP